MTIVDGDVVEEKNLDRQSFLLEDVGRNKASVFAEILNDALEGYNISQGCQTRWEAVPSYMTDADQITSYFKKLVPEYSSGVTVGSEYFYSYGKELVVNIPIIIGCVDNNAARLMMEEVFNRLDYCFLYDAGNEFSTGEVNFAHKMRGKVISPVKSVSFPTMKTGDRRHVTEMSCTELNASEPQHFLTNMTAGYHLLRGMINLFTDMKKPLTERISDQLGFVFFDSFKGVLEYVPRVEVRSNPLPADVIA
jgi:hypothetical protein